MGKSGKMEAGNERRGGTPVAEMDDKRLEAQEKYISGSMSLRALAEEMGLSPTTVRKWSRAGNWPKEREKVQKRALRRAATRAVDKKARELEKLILASGAAENALLLAMRQFEQKIQDSDDIVDGKFRAGNFSSLVHALGRQAETRLMIGGIVLGAEKEKLELLRRRQELEERKAQAEQETGAAEVRLILEPEMEDLLSGKNGGDSDAVPKPAAEIIPSEQ